MRLEQKGILYFYVVLGMRERVRFVHFLKVFISDLATKGLLHLQGRPGGNEHKNIAKLILYFNLIFVCCRRIKSCAIELVVFRWRFLTLNCYENIIRKWRGERPDWFLLKRGIS